MMIMVMEVVGWKTGEKFLRGGGWRKDRAEEKD